MLHYRANSPEELKALEIIQGFPENSSVDTGPLPCSKKILSECGAKIVRLIRK